MIKEFKYQASGLMPVGTMSQIDIPSMIWIYDTFGEQGERYQICSYSYGVRTMNTGKVEVIIRFRDEEDAVLFKLSWS